MLLTLRVFVCLQFNGLSLIVGYAEERLAREGDRLSFYCDINSTADSSVLWLYTPGEAYERVEYIYSQGRMQPKWRSRCLVTTNVASSTLVLPSVHPTDAGYYECSDDRFDGIVIRLRVKLTVAKTFEPVTSINATAELSQPYFLTDRITAWDQNTTSIKGTPDSLSLVNEEANLISLANLNAFVMIGGIVLVIIFLAVVFTALLTVALKKIFRRRNKLTRSTQGEMDGYADIQSTTINYAEQRNGPGNDSNARQDFNSLHDYEEIPSITSNIRVDFVEYDTSSDRNHQRNANLAQVYAEIPATTIHEEQGRVHLVDSLNDEINNYCQAPKYFSPMNYEEISHTSLFAIIPGSLNDQEAGEEGEYWPMVRDGYVEITQRPNVSAVVYEVLHRKKESQQTRRTRLRQFRFFRQKIHNK